MTSEKTSKKKKRSKTIETGQEEERQSDSATSLPFRRVDDSIAVDSKLSNNSFEAKVLLSLVYPLILFYL